MGQREDLLYNANIGAAQLPPKPFAPWGCSREKGTEGLRTSVPANKMPFVAATESGNSADCIKPELNTVIIYIVTSGSYSDYGINSVFSSQALAQEFIDKHTPSDFNIEEYEVDFEKDVERQDVWDVKLFADTGDAFSWSYQLLDATITDKPTSRIDVPFRSRAKSWNYRERLVIQAQSTVSHEHALKSCAEARQLYLRTGVEPVGDFF